MAAAVLLLATAGNVNAQGKIEWTTAPKPNANNGQLDFAIKITPDAGWEPQKIKEKDKKDEFHIVQIIYWESGGKGVVKSHFVEVTKDGAGNWVRTDVLKGLESTKEYNVIIMANMTKKGQAPKGIGIDPAKGTPK